MTRQRAPLAISLLALVTALLGATPLGRAAGEGLAAAIPPFAKKAGYAKRAGNAARLNGRPSTLAGAPGTIPVVGKDGKLPASLGAIGPQGPKGDPGPAGPRGPAGVTGWTFRTQGLTVQPGQIRTATAGCPAGTKALGGGVNHASGYDTDTHILNLAPSGQADGWYATIFNDGSANLTLSYFVWVICAAVGT